MEPAVDGEVVELPGDGPAWLRPIVPDDAEALMRFHDSLSPATVRRRFFDFHRHLAAREVERFTRVDGADRVALVVATATEILAVGRYDRVEGSAVAEIAFVVADVYQRQGLGPLLLERLADRARQVGVRSFQAETLADNSAMLAVFSQSGYPMRTWWGAGVVEVSLDLGQVQEG